MKKEAIIIFWYTERILFSTQFVLVDEQYRPYLHNLVVSENPGIEIQGFCI